MYICSILSYILEETSILKERAFSYATIPELQMHRESRDYQCNLEFCVRENKLLDFLSEPFIVEGFIKGALCFSILLTLREGGGVLCG